jgi:hypothetical protein
MNQATEPCVAYNSPEAAQTKTVTGWVDRHGRFWGNDEHMARWSGCTHAPCADCGAATEKLYTVCQGCRDLRALKRFEALPRAPWDGSSMLYSDAFDAYFSDLEEVYEFLADQDESVTIEDLRLVICRANRAHALDGSEWSDALPEDGDLPEALVAALDQLNAVIAQLEPLSWSPGKTALDVAGLDPR